jgi:hypothetical protein
MHDCNILDVRHGYGYASEHVSALDEVESFDTSLLLSLIVSVPPFLLDSSTAIFAPLSRIRGSARCADEASVILGPDFDIELGVCPDAKWSQYGAGGYTPSAYLTGVGAPR